MGGRRAPEGFGRALPALAAFSYVLLIAYGSLFPFADWQQGAVRPLAFLTGGLPKEASASDLFVNIVAYVPLGLLFWLWPGRAFPRVFAAVLAVLLGTLVSFGMEATQSYLPSRVSSLGDLLANAAGTAFGAGGAWLLSSRSGIGAAIHRWRENFLLPGAQAEIGFATGCLGMFVLLGPLIPSLDAGGRISSVLPVWQAFFDATGMTPMTVMAYAAQAFGLMALCVTNLRPDRPRFAVVLLVLVALLFVKFCVAVLYLSVPVHRWVLSGKALVGGVLAVTVLWTMVRRDVWLATAGSVALLAAFLIAQLSGVGEAATYVLTSPGATRLNWVPFQGQMHGSTGVLDVLSTTLQFLTLGCLASAATPHARRRVIASVGALTVFAVAFATEWAQQSIAGRHPDITDAVLALAGWLVAWVWAPGRGGTRSQQDAAVVGGREPSRRPRVQIVGALLLFVAGVLGVLQVLTRPVELPLHGSSLPRHPLATELPPVKLSGFRMVHPRLPAPSAADIATLRTRGADYLAEQRRFSRGGAGNLESAILMAVVEPGSQDLDRIFRRLMEVKFHYRGNGTETVAMGYDWLYDRWSEEQRRQLRERVAEGFDFTYRVIRDERLSPYNVYFYNSPFQRLLALAIVLYGDDPRGEGAMRIAHHLLKNDVLPVWRQIMGRNGGWHEGGEYVGIGIGQAVYRVPAMWLAATGEDLFRSEPYLRGFLEFLTYRIRPDGSQFRWGDASFFDKDVPDQAALALEYDYPAAQVRARPFTPTSWPWGPLADPARFDRGARERLPTSKLFDGIGLVVARSDWSAGATYVTFKAGENYWSHSHLDQGAFTIFKGGALAIDSGLYGPEYGSDHHMNYTYQTIAHNTLTVTDPEDAEPVVNKRGEKRYIANDGGQRRVGSGWGIEPAPVNLDEWQARREIYHTGKIEAYVEDEGLTIAVADVTAAYTNAYSGAGTFSHRTRRVERAWRVFAYDRVDDVVVVQDQVLASEPQFRKRWLLHSIEPPVAGDRRFVVRTFPADKPTRTGGSLHGVVVFPEDAQLNVVGGRGFEFDVDGVNYDEGGRVAASAARRPDVEPGSWRIELMPGRDRLEDQFLVVMLPGPFAYKPSHTVTRLAANGRTGCEIVGPRRTTRWWFTPGANGVEVEIDAPGGRKTLRAVPAAR